MADQIQASHILIGTDRRDKETALGEINAVRQEIVDGADFADVARAKSDCPSGARGGDLGSFGRGVMVPSFEDAAFALEKDSLSDVVETDFGYHLILRTG